MAHITWAAKRIQTDQSHGFNITWTAEDTEQSRNYDHIDINIITYSMVNSVNYGILQFVLMLSKTIKLSRKGLRFGEIRTW